MSKKAKRTADVRLQEGLNAILGNGWRHKLTLSISAHRWYWLLHLARLGLEAKKAERRAAGNHDATCWAASIADWTMDLDMVTDALLGAAQQERIDSLDENGGASDE